MIEIQHKYAVPANKGHDTASLRCQGTERRKTTIFATVGMSDGKYKEKTKQVCAQFVAKSGRDSLKNVNFCLTCHVLERHLLRLHNQQSPNDSFYVSIVRCAKGHK